MFMPSLSIAYGLESTTLSNDDAIPFLQEKLKRCDTPVLHGIKHMLIQALLSWENAIKANKFGVEKFADSIEKARNNIEMIKSDDVLVDEIKRKISEFESESRRLDTERNKKFDEAGKIAYKEYLKNKPDHPPAVVTKWNELEDIDSLISRNKQDLSGLKQREKKTGFLAKLGDSITSTAKSGKLKFDVHNLERKKDGVITEFGRVLYNSHKNGDNTLEELSSIWQNIDDMEQQISKNEEEIAKLRKYI
jgi:seryl-tRNA synthetase